MHLFQSSYHLCASYVGMKNKNTQKRHSLVYSLSKAQVSDNLKLKFPLLKQYLVHGKHECTLRKHYHAADSFNNNNSINNN